MPDETIKIKTATIDDAGDEKPVVKSTEKQPEEITQPKPAWQERFKTPEEIYEFARQKQSEADKAKAELDRTLQVIQQVQPQPQIKQPTTEEMVDMLVKDPVGFYRQVVGPDLSKIEARMAWSEFKETHPGIDSQMKQEMGSYIGRNPNVLSDPDGLNMVYTYVKSKQDAEKLAVAADKTAEHKSQIEETKKKDAFLETSSTTKKQDVLEIKPGMRSKEMNEIMDKKGVGWYKPDS